MDSTGSTSEKSEAKDIPQASTSIRDRTESESSDKYVIITLKKKSKRKLNKYSHNHYRSGPKFILPGTPNSPPKILSLDEVQNITKNIQNMALAHEIAVNSEFKLQVK